jgi:3'(2'),5'-bisphosphate nucleotidase
VTIPVDDALMEGLIRAALAGGDEVMAVYATEFDTSLKGDASPVTAADERAEAVILAQLARVMPGVPVVAEESAAAGQVPADLGQVFVLVDPLDGTKEFISRNGEFTVNIGVIAEGRPVAGVVLAPALGRIWWGIVGRGAWVAEVEVAGLANTRAISIRPVTEEGLTVLASRSHCGAETEAVLAKLSVCDRVAAGSSLKFCRIAEGAADFYPRLGRTMEWDTAAADAVLRAAGGKVLTLVGGDLAYGKRNQTDDTDFANPWFLALGGARAEDVLAACR